MTYRYRVDYLASGQPRPYADSRNHVRLTIDLFRAWLGDPNDARSEWVPNDSWGEDEIRALLPHLRCGFIATTAKERKHGLEPYLDWLRKTAPGVWEFHVTSPYTD
jgi:hypothetical protein